MSEFQPAQIFSSGGEHSKPDDLHMNPVVFSDHGSLVMPLRFRYTEEDPVFNRASVTKPVFQDVLWLLSNHRDLVDKVRKNLYCRLNKAYPKRPRWYCPWRKQQLDIGVRLYITYKLGDCAIYNECEVNEANWPDMRALLRGFRPTDAVFHVDWWFKGERVTYVEEYFETCDKM